MEDSATFVIVGGGIAGVSCAEMLSVLCPHQKILLLTASPVIKAVANLSHLTKLLAAFDVQEETATDFSSKYANLVVVVTPSPVASIDPAEKYVECASGQRFGYTHSLGLCHGARPKLIDGVQGPGGRYVVGIRDNESVRDFQGRLSGARRIVIVGNGGIATEMVYELQTIDIVWAVKDDAISANFIDAGAAQFFSAEINSKNDRGDCPTKRHKYTASSEVGRSSNSTGARGGALGPDWHNHILTQGLKSAGGKRIQIEYETDVKSLEGDPGCFKREDWGDISLYEDETNWNLHVELSNGKVIGCDFVVSATGVIPNGDTISVIGESQTGLKLSPEDGGIVVNEQMETNLERVYAAGDVCHAEWAEKSRHWFQMRLWTQARQMGMYLGQCMHADWENGEKKDLDFSFEMFAHSTKFFGLKVILLGLYNGQGMATSDYEVLLRVTKGREYVKTVMSRDGRMQGALLIGETDLEETFENLILNQMDLSSYGADLLDPNIDIEDYFD